MIDAMFDMPSAKDVKEFKVTLEYAQEKVDNSEIEGLKVA